MYCLIILWLSIPDTAYSGRDPALNHSVGHLQSQRQYVAQTDSRHFPSPKQVRKPAARKHSRSPASYDARRYHLIASPLAFHLQQGIRQSLSDHTVTSFAKYSTATSISCRDAVFPKHCCPKPDVTRLLALHPAGR